MNALHSTKVIECFYIILKIFQCGEWYCTFLSQSACLFCGFAFFCLRVTFLVTCHCDGCGGCIVDMIDMLHNIDTYWNDFMLRWRFDFTHHSYHSSVVQYCALGCELCSNNVTVHSLKCRWASSSSLHQDHFQYYLLQLTLCSCKPHLFTFWNTCHHQIVM